MGKHAAIVVLNSNPRNTVDFEDVMKDGRLFDAMTLDEIHPEPRTLARRRRWRPMRRGRQRESAGGSGRPLHRNAE